MSKSASYGLETAPAPAQESLFFAGDAVSSPERNAEQLLDDPQEWPSFGREQSASATTDMQAWESHVVVEGMHCAACALTIEEALCTVPGVLKAEVSAATQRAKVVWQPGQVLPSQWMAAVRKAGYSALPAMDARARELRQREHRKALWRWLLAGFCMMQVMMYAWPAYIAAPGDLTQEMEALLRWASWVITLPVVVFACTPFFSSALRDIRHRRVSMDLPVALGMAITFIVSMAGTFDPDGLFGREVFYDSLTMFVFFLLTGRWLELRLRDRTAGSLEAVMNRLPDSVERRCTDGSFERVAVRRLAVDDVVRVLPGEAFPADGCIVQGQTLADEALMTGESKPVPRQEGSLVTAGSFNLQSVVEVKVQGTGQSTRFAQIVALMESASLQKPRLAQLADRVARPFLLLVLAAAAVAVLWWWPTDPAHAVMVAVSVLIVTCPCALSLATPVAMLSAAGTLARHGVMVRNLQGLEVLAQVDTVVFDKTGTLTHDGMVVQSVHVQPFISRGDALGLASVIARHSLHPVSRALVAAETQSDTAPTGRWRVSEVQETPGYGLAAHVVDVDQQFVPMTVLLGSARHTQVPKMAMDARVAQQVILAYRTESSSGVTELARFDLSEHLRSGAAEAIQALRQAGIDVRLLSGDSALAVGRIAAQVKIPEWQGDCTPQDKLAVMQALQSQGRQVVMVGDGLNDGPVLAGAHASFAFGRAVPLAQSRSDFVVLGANLGAISQTVLHARRTLRVVRQNLWWAAGYNAVSVPLAIAGYMPAWLAGLGMALSSLLVVLNAARLSRALPEFENGGLHPLRPTESVQPVRLAT